MEQERFYTPKQVAEFLGCSDQAIRTAARQAPEKLGFPVCIIGSRVRIPVIPFRRFMGWL